MQLYAWLYAGLATRSNGPPRSTFRFMMRPLPVVAGDARYTGEMSRCCLALRSKYQFTDAGLEWCVARAEESLSIVAEFN